MPIQIQTTQLTRAVHESSGQGWGEGTIIGNLSAIEAEKDVAYIHQRGNGGGGVHPPHPHAFVIGLHTRDKITA